MWDGRETRSGGQNAEKRERQTDKQIIKQISNRGLKVKAGSGEFRANEEIAFCDYRRLGKEKERLDGKKREVQSMNREKRS